ncbi:uncharacterized protein LOC113209224 [Frankliniella occidentalis]|uniref:Uncharacterized protein LOC113209224 n=1 Tax=Frankliniella occidentalis TaxID=133901 RepID=A0A9C6TUI7_FRAOC|nr:uncharacterized protein LOC113209224 [Frankliniella occidentalis]
MDMVPLPHTVSRSHGPAMLPAIADSVGFLLVFGGLLGHLAAAAGVPAGATPSPALNHSAYRYDGLHRRSPATQLRPAVLVASQSTTTAGKFSSPVRSPNVSTSGRPKVMATRTTTASPTLEGAEESLTSACACACRPQPSGRRPAVGVTFCTAHFIQLLSPDRRISFSWAKRRPLKSSWRFDCDISNNQAERESWSISELSLNFYL